ncbi:hypothetical protein SUGI_0584510 [Cryptomeria japonica]|uniref:probable histone acetyltransferase type B catalytic subunit n=1 Tax=Cryptomeria japonica TaxID=3369 RepID=UPI002414A86F|nr:probable histone acetyltransferase type B catalytic subunit [Cryptomeria japonica]GLJ29645.1 hypothetical protein SUGI_0584510 [Cryptomeria japonica]
MAPVKRLEPEQVKRADEKPKRKKVAFVKDTGIDANECVSVYLVSSLEEMQDAKKLEDQGLSFNPEYMEQFVGEDGKIYGYKGLKIDVWLNSLSFHAYADIQYENKIEDSKSEKRTTDLKDLMKKIFGQGLMEDRDAFIQSLSSNSHHIESLIHNVGEIIETCEIHTDKTLTVQGDSGILGTVTSEEIIHLELADPGVKEWHSRLVPLVLLLVEGSQPIEQDDTKWEMYIAIQRELLNEGDTRHKLLGFCIVYRFYHYPDSTRLRISQILVFPPYQGKGHGLHILEAVNKIAVQRDSYDVTVEEPSLSLQELRDCMDTLRLLSFHQVRCAIKPVVERLKQAKVSDNTTLDHSLEGNGKGESSFALKTNSKSRSWWFPSPELVEEVRKHLKINKKQFKRCWETLVFLNLDQSDSQCQESYQILLMEQIMSELFDNSSEKIANGKRVIDIGDDHDSSNSFMMIRTKGSNAGTDGSVLPVPMEDGNGVESREDQLKAVFEERLEEITHVADKVSRHCKPLGIQVPIVSP